jgi:hypothetical protein
VRTTVTCTDAAQAGSGSRSPLFARLASQYHPISRCLLGLAVLLVMGKAGWVGTGSTNHDGIADLAAANGTLGEELVMILLDNGDGTFRNVGSFAVHNEPHSVAVGEFNSDGIQDLAVVFLVAGD